MSIKCPKCQTDNPDTQRFCGECGTPLPSVEEISFSNTKTLQMPIQHLTSSEVFAGRYQVIEELGKGGMGRVYKVMDTQINEEMALKILKPEIASDEGMLERFRNELKIARKITHRNVCRMHDINEEEGTPYITMEYVEGEDLKSLVKSKGRMSQEEAIAIAKQVCEGLSEAHELGVVHRDLKPQNIMADEKGRVRIMDFGIARSVEAPGVTMTGVIIGTPDYISPEQAEGEDADQRSDIYSLGVILYEMITGQVPFQGDTALSVALKHKSKIPLDPRKINPQISDDFARLILICMEKDREKRYQKAKDLLADLINIEQHRPLGARIIPRRKPIAIAFKPKKLLISALVIIALVIIGVVIWRLIPQEEVTLLPQFEKSIAVISFENQTGDKAYDYLQKAIPNLLITNLEQTGYLYVATWERLHDLCKQLDTEDGEFIDRELGMELCRMDGVKALVQGSFTKAGDMFATDIKVLEVKTGKLLNSTRSTGKGEESILQTQIDDLSKEIALSVGISDSDIEATQIEIADITTTSMEAYNYYLKGREEFKNYLWERARDSFKIAIERDPTFASAYSYLAETYGWLQNNKAARETTKQAMVFSDRAPEKEKLYIEAQHALRIERDRQKMHGILEQIAQKFPKEKRVRRRFAEMSEPENAIEECKKILEIDPQDSWALNEIGLRYYRMKNFDKALEYSKKAEAALAEYANPRDTLGMIYFAQGEMDKAKAKLKEAIEISTDLHWPYHTIAYIYAQEENYAEALRYLDQFINVSQSPGLKGHVYATKAFYLYWIGSMEQSLKEIQKAENLWREVENNYANYAVSWNKGWIFYDRKKFDLCRKWFKIHFQNQQESPGYYFYFGLLDLKEGLIDSAKENLAKMKTSLAQWKGQLFPCNQSWRNYLKAEILLSDRLFEEVIALIDKIPSFGSPADYPHYHPLIATNVPFEKDVFARAYHQSGELDKAIAEYERLLTLNTKGEERLLIHPKYHYRVAKLFEEKGWPGKAIEQYEKFLEIWKSADEDLPEKGDAQRRLLALQKSQ